LSFWFWPRFLLILTADSTLISRYLISASDERPISGFIRLPRNVQFTAHHDAKPNARRLDDPPQPRLDLRRLFRFHRRMDAKDFPRGNFDPLPLLNSVIPQ
jgi:hypothetical protein